MDDALNHAFSEDTVSHWIERLKGGDADAAGRLWDRYFERLATVARAKLGATPRAVADEEDLALSAIDSLFRGIAQGNFPRLIDRDNLWSLLATIVGRKVCDQVNAQMALKRGAGQTVAMSELSPREPEAALDRFLSLEPQPETLVMIEEECEQLLSALDADHRAIALGKLEGWTNEELARQLNCGLRTIERRLELIRRIWSRRVG